MSATVKASVAGWEFIRNADGCIGIKAPPAKEGESQRTSDCIYPASDRDLHELLSKFVDHLSAAQQPIGKVMRTGLRSDGKPWMSANFPQDGSADLPDGAPLYAAAPQEPPVSTPLTEAAIDEYLEDYEMRGEGPDGRDACHTPTEGERALIKDAIMGLLAETGPATEGVQLPPAYMLAKLRMVMPLFQEARDAITVITEAQRVVHGLDKTLAARMDEAGTFSLEDWELRTAKT